MSGSVLVQFLVLISFIGRTKFIRFRGLSVGRPFPASIKLPGVQRVIPWWQSKIRLVVIILRSLRRRSPPLIMTRGVIPVPTFVVMSKIGLLMMNSPRRWRLSVRGGRLSVSVLRSRRIIRFIMIVRWGRLIVFLPTNIRFRFRTGLGRISRRRWRRPLTLTGPRLLMIFLVTLLVTRRRSRRFSVPLKFRDWVIPRFVGGVMNLFQPRFIPFVLMTGLKPLSVLFSSL